MEVKMNKSKAYVDKVIIPTYEVLEENMNPSFAQYGGTGIYPYRLQDTLSKVKKDKEYEAVILENDFAQCTILPEIGGRLYSVVNKTDGTQWFYKNNVIKPALIGQRGAWISGGVEFNFPISHNPNTHDRVNYYIRTDCGHASVFIGNREAISDMDWCVELRLYDDRSFLEQRTILCNENPVPNRYYFWTNAAAEISRNSEYIYPYDHAVGMPEDGYFEWPGKGSVGSRWDRDYKRSLEFFGKNINKPWSGLYDHVKGKGLVHISNPRELRGIKIFSWGWCRDADMWSRVS